VPYRLQRRIMRLITLVFQGHTVFYVTPNDAVSHWKEKYRVEINCQLDATDEFLLQILVLVQHVSGTIMPIIRSSSVLYKWLLPVVFSAWFSSCRYGVELRVVCPVCGLPRQHKIRQAATTCIILSSS
jgi:hypothetical protein